jgi:hypothetical protein
LARLRSDAVDEVLLHITFGKCCPGAMVDAVDDHTLRFEINAKDDPMREIDEMADFMKSTDLSPHRLIRLHS